MVPIVHLLTVVSYGNSSEHFSFVSITKIRFKEPGNSETALMNTSDRCLLVYFPVVDAKRILNSAQPMEMSTEQFSSCTN